MTLSSRSEKGPDCVGDCGENGMYCCGRGDAHEELGPLTPIYKGMGQCPYCGIEVDDAMIERGARALFYAARRGHAESYDRWAEAVPVFAKDNRRQAEAVLRAALSERNRS